MKVAGGGGFLPGEGLRGEGEAAGRGKEAVAGRSCDTICKVDLFKFYRAE